MSYMPRERLSEYLRSLEVEKSPEILELRKYAREHGVPVIREETEAFLRTLLAILKPSRILEIGTAIGFSALVMAESSDAYIVTLENYPPHIEKARETFASCGLTERTKLISQDAAISLAGFPESESFDFVFLDAAKGQYLGWLPLIMAHMHEGSVLLADDVLMDLGVIESRYTLARRDRSTHRRMREFIYEIKHHPRLETAVIPLGNGVSLSVVKRGGETG